MRWIHHLEHYSVLECHNTYCQLHGQIINCVTMFEKSRLSLLNEQLFGNEITQKAQSIASQFFIKQFTLFLHLPRRGIFRPVPIEFLFEVWILKWSISKKAAVFAVSSWRDNEDRSYLVTTNIYFIFWNLVKDSIVKLTIEKEQTKFPPSTSDIMTIS